MSSDQSFSLPPLPLAMAGKDVVHPCWMKTPYSIEGGESFRSISINDLEGEEFHPLDGTQDDWVTQSGAER
jgi:hypothetical protein